MRIIAMALLAAGLMMPGVAAATSIDATGVLAQATAADQPTPKKTKARRKRAPKVEYMRAVPSR
jgi:hypothetical protein